MDLFLFIHLHLHLVIKQVLLSKVTYKQLYYIYHMK